MIFGSFAINAQNTVDEANAALIYNIAKYVDWSAVNDASFDIVVVNQPKLFAALKTYYSKKVINGKAVTLILDKTNRTDFTGSEIVISGNKKITGENILTINMSGRNAIANLVQENEKIKIKINKNLADKNNVKISSSLLSIVEIIE